MSNETGFAAWLNSRMPTLQREWKRHMSEYYAPKNFNFWYYFGVLSMVVLVIQLVTLAPNPASGWPLPSPAPCSW